jgi:PAS domain S-box-containing protein
LIVNPSEVSPMDNAFSSVIIESMSDGVLVLDFQGHITHINPAGLDLLGFGALDIQERTYAQLFMDQAENDGFNDILIRGIQERETRLYREVPFRRRDGRLLDLAVTTSFLRLESGRWETPGIVVVFKDITEFKALDRARRRVLDHLSHELRTPLSIVSSSLRSLETPENQRILDRIRRNLKRLQDIQMDVEDIVRTEAPDQEDGHRTCVEQTVDLLQALAEGTPGYAEALNAVEEIIEVHLPHRDMDLQASRLKPVIERAAAMVLALSSHRHVRMDIEIREDPYALMNVSAVEKGLMTLTKNAIENTPDGGTVTISLGASPDGIELVVRDTGVGITEESQKQIFGGFYHARETDYYSTRRPFDFDAGGKGLELLKLGMFADAYRFHVACESSRCIYLSGEDATCPGTISQCPHVEDDAGCASAGGTTFSLVFPIATDPDQV